VKSRTVYFSKRKGKTLVWEKRTCMLGILHGSLGKFSKRFRVFVFYVYLSKNWIITIKLLCFVMKCSFESQK